MLKISRAVSAGQAKKYYQTELQTERDASMSNSAAEVSLDAESLERTSGKWHGKLADEMGLRGAVTTEQFERLCDGHHPFTEEELVRHAPVKHYTNRFGKEITTMEHRALWDGTFSAPKSVSLAAVAGGDDRIREAHRASVRSALDEVEKYVEARMGGEKMSERTGKMVAAVFEHDTARPDKTFKFAAPQLHTHAVIFNATMTEAGLTKPVQPLEVFKTQKYATAVYRIELADRLRKLGYEIEIDPKTKAPEIKGFDSEYLKECSRRSQEIQMETEAIKTRFETAGAEIKSDAGIRQIAAWQQRESKGFDPEEMKTRALELEVKYDFQAQKIYGQALRNSGYQYDAVTERQKAVEAIDFAKQTAFPPAGLDASQASLSASQAADYAKLNERQFLTEALEKGIGATNFAAVQREYVTRSAAGEFANLIKNENEKSSPRELPSEAMKSESYESGKSASAGQSSESASPEKTKSVKAAEKISMDDLENAVREKVVAEREVVQSLELFIGI